MRSEAIPLRVHVGSRPAHPNRRPGPGARCDRFRPRHAQHRIQHLRAGRERHGKDLRHPRVRLGEGEGRPRSARSRVRVQLPGSRGADRPFPASGEGDGIPARHAGDGGLPSRGDSEGFRFQGVRGTKRPDRRGIPESPEGDFRIAGGGCEIEGVHHPADDQRFFHRRGGRFGRADDGGEVQHAGRNETAWKCGTTGGGSRNGWTTWSVR